MVDHLQRHSLFERIEGDELVSSNEILNPFVFGPKLTQIYFAFAELGSGGRKTVRDQ